MPNVKKIQNNLNAGELSPKVMGRTDLDKYHSGCETLENYLNQPYGGITRRPGTKFVAETKTMTKQARLVPFDVSVTNAYVLEFGDQYIRFFKNGQIVYGGAVVNLVVNGTFDAGIGSWNNYSNYLPNFYWDSGGKRACFYASVGDSTVAGQSFATIAGHTYRLSFSIPFRAVTEGTAKAKVGTALHGSSLVNADLQSGTNTLTFVASGATTYLEFALTAFGTFMLDNVEVIDLAGSVLELATPYSEGDLPDLKFAQSADVLYIVHPAYAPRKLLRYSETSWAIKTVPFAPPATKEQPLDLNTTLTPAATTGQAINFTPGVDVFLAADVGRLIVFGDSVAVIMSLSADAIKKAVCDIVVDFPDTNPIAAGAWTLGGSPNTTCSPSAVGPVGSIITVTLGANAARSADVGKYIRGNSGLAKITVYTSPTSVKAQVLVQFASTTAIPGGAWTLEEAAWVDTAARPDDFPSAICFYEQRLLLGGVKTMPTTLWGSQSGDYENFNRGALAADALEYTTTPNTADKIAWIAQARSLLIGTGGCEMRMAGGDDQPLTPTNVDNKTESTFGSSSAAPIRIGEFILFVQRSKKSLYSLLYTSVVQPLKWDNLTVLADHITGDGVEELSYEQSPLSIVWARRADGVMLAMTFMPGQEVVGWSRHITDGIVESHTTIPGIGSDQTWLIVKRTINGATKRYVEYFDSNLYTDCAYRYSGAPITAVTGLSHLEGKAVAVVADGEEVTGKTVAAGAITLATAASNIEVGLPYTPKLVTVRPEVREAGTIQGSLKRWAECWVRVISTRGITINAEPQEPDAITTGDIRINNLTHDRDGKITIEQPHPYPSTILAIFGTLEVGS